MNKIRFIEFKQKGSAVGRKTGVSFFSNYFDEVLVGTSEFFLLKKLYIPFFLLDPSQLAANGPFKISINNTVYSIDYIAFMLFNFTFIIFLGCGEKDGV